MKLNVGCRNDLNIYYKIILELKNCYFFWGGGETTLPVFAI